MIAEMDIPSLFVLVLLGGMVGAFLLAKFLLPRIGDKVGAFFYTGLEAGAKPLSSPALALVAQGDFEGAIAEYEKQIAASPSDLLAVSEVAKLRAERLGDVSGAVNGLRGHLQSRSWTLDEVAFLRFRVVDVLSLGNPRQRQAAADELQQIVAAYPASPHSAHAIQRLKTIGK